MTMLTGILIILLMFAVRLGIPMLISYTLGTIIKATS